jgi:predicted AAA+ superfamily ATPase
LQDALYWGTLPKISQLNTDEEKKGFLKAYAEVYLKEEVWAEQLVRSLDPFRKFLQIAAQSSGEIVNYSSIAQDVGVDSKTVQTYFQILEDTLLGFMLEPFHRSVRKQQRQSPKFYLFDLGVKRALERLLDHTLAPGTYAYGKAFEHWVILEAIRMNHYLGKDYGFFYLRTKEQAEIDLIVERPGGPPALVEIKSATHVDERHARTLEQFIDDFKGAEAFCLSLDPVAKKIGRVLALPWERGLGEIFK